MLDQIDENGIGIGKHYAVVVNHRDLAEGVQRKERRLLVLTGRQIDFDDVVINPQDTHHQLDAMGVAGERGAVEFDRLSVHWESSVGKVIGRCCPLS